MLIEVASDDEGGVTRGGLIARCAVARGRTMSPGIQQAAYYWRDVVHGPPPRRRAKGDCLQVTFHGTDDSGDVRIGFTTIVRVDPGMDKDSADDDIIHIEERVNVQRRALQELIDRERAFTDRMCLRMRSRLAHRLVAQRRLAQTIRIVWLASMVLALTRVQAKVGTSFIRGFRALMRGLVAWPDAFLTHTTNAGIHLGSRYGRKLLRKAIRDPASATPQEKTLALVVGSFTLAVGILLFDFALIVFDFPFFDAVRHIETDFLKSLGSVLALPIPVEILLITSIFAVGATLAFVGLFLGKVVGSWMLYLLGDSLYDSIEKRTRTRPRMRRSVEWLQSSANRFGFLMLLIINAIPFIPDLLIIIFAVSGMRFRSYFWGIALGTALKFLAIIAAVSFVGPETARAFFEHPIQTLRGG